MCGPWSIRILVCLFGVAACSSGSSAVPCSPGIEVPCTCEDGARGSAVCQTEDRAYGPCDCSAPLGSVDAAVDGDAGDSGGEGGANGDGAMGIRDTFVPDTFLGCGAYGAYESGVCKDGP